MARAAFLVFVALLPTALCCDKMNVQLVEANTNCPDGEISVFQMSPNFNFTLTEDCILEFQGWVEMTRNVSSAMLHYKVSTGGRFLVDDEEDGCELMENINDDFKLVFGLFDFPNSCPIAANKINADGKAIPLRNHKDKLFFSSGNVKGECIADHKEAGKSCLNFVLSLTRKQTSA